MTTPVPIPQFLSLPQSDIPDYYQWLDVESEADDKKISKNFRSLMQVYHPDKYKGDKEQATIWAKSFVAARDLLLDPVERGIYDEARSGVLASKSSKSSSSSSSSASSSSSVPSASSSWPTGDDVKLEPFEDIMKTIGDYCEKAKSDGETLVQYAAEGDWDNAMKFFQNNPLSWIVPDKNGCTILYHALHITSATKRGKVITKLLKNNVSVNQLVDGIERPLHLALRLHDEYLVVSFLKHGANISFAGVQGPALHQLIADPLYDDDPKLWNRLFEHVLKHAQTRYIAENDIDKSFGARTAVVAAATKRQWGVVKTLVQSGARIDAELTCLLDSAPSSLVSFVKETDRKRQAASSCSIS